LFRDLGFDLVEALPENGEPLTDNVVFIIVQRLLPDVVGTGPAEGETGQAELDWKKPVVRFEARICSSFLVKLKKTRSEMLNLLQHDTCGVIENNQIDSCSFFFLVRKCQHQFPTQSVSPLAEGRLASTMFFGALSLAMMFFPKNYRPLTAKGFLSVLSKRPAVLCTAKPD